MESEVKTTFVGLTFTVVTVDGVVTDIDEVVDAFEGKDTVGVNAEDIVEVERDPELVPESEIFRCGSE